MRPSPLQLRHVLYTKVSVLPRTSKGEKAPKGLDFDFEGVKIRSQIKSGIKQGQEKDPRDFLVGLNIAIDNNEGKASPYSIDIGVLGLFHVLPSLPLERREDLVTVNGASILYGVVREIVLSLTSRFTAGPLTLPGMNFEDSAPSVRAASAKVPSPARVESGRNQSPKLSRKVRRRT